MKSIENGLFDPVCVAFFYVMSTCEHCNNWNMGPVPYIHIDAFIVDFYCWGFYQKNFSGIFHNWR